MPLTMAEHRRIDATLTRHHGRASQNGLPHGTITAETDAASVTLGKLELVAQAGRAHARSGCYGEEACARREAGQCGVKE